MIPVKGDLVAPISHWLLIPCAWRIAGCGFNGSYAVLYIQLSLALENSLNATKPRVLELRQEVGVSRNSQKLYEAASRQAAIIESLNHGF